MSDGAWGFKQAMAPARGQTLRVVAGVVCLVPVSLDRSTFSVRSR